MFFTISVAAVTVSVDVTILCFYYRGLSSAFSATFFPVFTRYLVGSVTDKLLAICQLKKGWSPPHYLISSPEATFAYNIVLAVVW
jgi:hypothetical protein